MAQMSIRYSGASDHCRISPTAHPNPSTPIIPYGFDMVATALLAVSAVASAAAASNAGEWRERFGVDGDHPPAFMRVMMLPCAALQISW